MNLTSEQVLAIREGEPISLVPPEVGEACVLLRKDVYEKVKNTAADDLPSSLAVSRLMAAVAGEEDLESYQQCKR
jgi:hypothetical protein